MQLNSTLNTYFSIFRLKTLYLEKQQKLKEEHTVIKEGDEENKGTGMENLA